MAELTGRVIANHQVLERLGRGGMAEVYKAFHAELAMHRAIKVIRPEFVEEEGFTERFRTEAQAIAALRHPGTVQLHDFGEADGLHYMVMEFIDGTDLAQLIKDDKAPRLDEAVAIVRAIAEAVAEAHERGIVHRDIKPANIMISTTGRAILTDFGIAKISSR